MNIPKTPDPWQTITHEGERYMVRFSAKVWWVVRLSDRATWMFDEQPEWTKGATWTGQGDLF